MEPLVWPLMLLLLALLFVGLELFIPSSGILTVLAGSAVLAALYLGFAQSTIHGLIVLMTALILVPAVIVLAIHVWPKTPIGRRLILQPDNPHDGLPDDEEEQRRRELVGKFGTAKSRMLPSGAIVIDGQTYDAVSRGNPIEPGTPIRVISVSGNRIVVAPADPRQAAQASASPDVLAQPIDSLGIDPFDDTRT